MGMPAARKGDKIACPLPNPPIAPPKPPTFPIHAPPPGNAISVIADNHNVEIGGAIAARIGDFSKCNSPETPNAIPNPILQGSIPVRIGNKPAARSMDSATHPGSIIASPCCKSVLIGLAGCGGNPWDGEDACKEAALGRSSGKTNQSYDNCGVESARQLINKATGAGLNEKELLAQAINAGNASGSISPAGALSGGGTVSAGQVGILASSGVPASRMAQSLGNIAGAVSNGQGVISAVWAGKLWTPQQLAGNGIAPGSAVGGHAVTVTGVEYDSNGNVVAVFINDTGTGECNKRIPARDFEAALMTNNRMAVTDNPIW